MNLQEHIRKVLKEEERYDDKVGRIFWFEYHCYESPESCDAEIWYRSHQKVKVIGVSEWSYDDKEWRQEDGNPRVYLVEWSDGYQYDVFEDELMESPDEFHRPDPPKRKIQEHIRKVLKEWYIKRDGENESGVPYLVIEKVLNRIIGKKYDWWKDIKIKDILYSEMSDTIEIYGKIFADKNWVKKRYQHYRGYELTNDEDYIRLDDIVDGVFLKELSDNITQVLRGLTNYRTAKKTRLEWNQIKPV